MTTKINGTNTAASPAITGADTDTGLSFGTDTVNINTGGATRLEIKDDGTNSLLQNSNGYLGIRSDALYLQDKTNGHAYITCVKDGAVGLRYDNTQTFNTQTNGVKIDSAGDTILEMHTSNAGAHNRINFSVNSGDNYGGLWYSAGYNSMEFRTNNAERMRINNQGDLQIGQNANDCRLGIKQRSSAVDFMYLRDASDNLKYYIHTSGNVYNTNGTYGQISDQSLKENIVDAKSQWNDIKNIKIRNFNFTEASGYDTHTQIGCVAQEVETVSPKLVTTPREDGIKTVSTSVLYMKAIKALQEAMEKIEALETKVAALEAG